jgi:hypothetical protein
MVTTSAGTKPIQAPWVTLRLRLAEEGLPRHPEENAVATMASSLLPTRELITCLTGMGVLAALQVIEWQMALARGTFAVVAGTPPDRRDDLVPE